MHIAAQSFLFLSVLFSNTFPALALPNPARTVYRTSLIVVTEGQQPATPAPIVQSFQQQTTPNDDADDDDSTPTAVNKLQEPPDTSDNSQAWRQGQAIRTVTQLPSTLATPTASPVPSATAPSSGTDTSGSDPTGSDPTGSDPTGSDTTGSDPTGSDTSGGDKPSDAILAEILSEHNKHRSQAGYPLLAWNESLAATSREDTENKVGPCVMEHSKRPGVGENLTKGYKPGKAVVDAWYDEKKDYQGDYAQGTGHYSQVMWKSSTDLGCYASKCDQPVVRCQYYPPGNMMGDFGQNVPS